MTTKGRKRRPAAALGVLLLCPLLLIPIISFVERQTRNPQPDRPSGLILEPRLGLQHVPGVVQVVRGRFSGPTVDVFLEATGGHTSLVAGARRLREYLNSHTPPASLAANIRVYAADPYVSSPDAILVPKRLADEVDLWRRDRPSGGSSWQMAERGRFIN